MSTETARPKILGKINLEERCLKCGGKLESLFETSVRKVFECMQCGRNQEVKKTNSPP